MTEREGSVPTLVPQVYFGVSPEVSGCGVFLDDFTFGHVSGRLFVTEDFRTRKQRFNHFPKFGNHHLISGVAFDSKRNIIVVADEGEPPTLNVYRLKDHENILTFVPKEYTSVKFTSMFVHSDCERISALLGPPDNLIYTLHLGSKSVEAVTPALHKDMVTEVTQIVGHQEDTFHYAVLGIGLLRFVTWMGDIWEDVFHSFNKAEGLAITCGTYTAIDTLLVGTADGKLVLISHEGIKAVYDPQTIDRIYIEIKKKGVKSSKPLEPPTRNVIVDGFQRNNDVQFLQTFRRGIIYMVKGEKEETIHVMLKGRFGDSPPYWTSDTSYIPPPEDDPFPNHGFIKIHIGKVEEYATLHEINRPLYVATNIAINFSGKCIALTFAGRFIMVLDVRDDFDPPKLLPAAHILSVGYTKCPVDHIASCILKNVFITAGEKTVKLFDYRSKESYIMYTFEDDIYSISLHPTGCFGLIGFTEKTVLFGLQQQTFLPIVELNVECCKFSTFSNGGDLMVIAEETKLRVYSVYSFQQISEINDGEAGKISGMKFCPQNNHLWTSRSTGAIVQTNIKDGIMKYFFSSSPKASFDEFENFRRIYFTGFDGSIEELDTTERCVIQKIYLRHGNLTDLKIAKSWNIIIVGTETGYVLVFSCPLKKDAIPLYKEKMHYAPIMKIALSKDETRLFTSAKDGSICIWKLIDESIEKRWNGVYVKSEGFPIPNNYKEAFDQFPIQRLVDLEKNYFTRQEKLMMSKTKTGILSNLNSLLNCLKSYELHGVLHPPTKLKRFKQRDYWRSLHNKGRDHLLEEQKHYEKFLKDFYSQTSDYIDVFKYCDEKEKDYKVQYISRVKYCYEEIKEVNKCLSGVPFHDMKGNVLSQIRKQKQFCEQLKANSKKMLKDIETKGRDYIEMKSSPSVLKRVKKEREVVYRAKQLMSTVLHRKVFKILKLFRALNEAKKCNAERSTQQECRPSTRGSGSLSLLHSADPSDSVNVNYTYLIEHSPPTSATPDSSDRARKVLWPMENNEKSAILKKKIQDHRKGKTTSLSFGETQKKNDTKSDEEKEDENEILGEGSCESDKILGDTFVIKRVDKPLKTNKRSLKSAEENKYPLKRKSYRELLVRLQAQREKNLKLKDWLKEWNPALWSIKIPLIDDKYSFFERNVPKFWSNMKSHVKKNNHFKATPANFEVFPKMFDHFKHFGKFVNQITPFRALKRSIIKGKFRDVLLTYSPSSKLTKLAVKNLIVSKAFLAKCAKEIVKYPNVGAKSLVEYDPFLDVSEDKLTFVPSSPLEFSQLSYFMPQKQHKANHNAYKGEALHACAVKNAVPHESLVSKLNEFTKYKKIKLDHKWEKLRRDAYPFSERRNGITPFTSTEEYQTIFESIFKKNLELPINVLPILRELMKSHSQFYKKSFQESITKQAIFPLKDIWILKSVNAIKYLYMPISNLDDLDKVKSVKKSNLKELYNENKDSSEFFSMGQLKRTYKRVGMLDLLSQERLNYGVCHKDKWDVFNPPISKNLMSVLLKTDYLHDLEKNFQQSSSEISTESDCFVPDSTEIGNKEVTLKPSDTDIWKNYFTEKDRIANLADNFEIQMTPQVEPLTEIKFAPSSGFEASDLSVTTMFETCNSQNLTTASMEDTATLFSQDFPSKTKISKKSLFEYEITSKFFVREKEELQKMMVKYIELLKKYEMYFINSKLFPVIKILKTLEKCDVQLMNMEDESDIHEISPTLNIKDTPVPAAPVVSKDGARGKSARKTSVKQSSALTEGASEKRQFGAKNNPRILDRHIVTNKVSEWLVNSNRETRGKHFKKTGGNFKQFDEKKQAGESSSSFQVPDTNDHHSENKYYDSEYDGSCKLKKDGCKEEAIVEKERMRKLWEMLYYDTFSLPKIELRNIAEPYSLRLWTKIFHTLHPKTVESFEDFNSRLKDLETFQFKKAPEMSYSAVYKESLPKQSDPDDPLDEIETVSSLQYIAVEEPSKKLNSYSLFTKQNVRIRTNLKSKVWFIPDEKGNGKGKFYYPGSPGWHKGYISRSLQITQKGEDKENISKSKIKTSRVSSFRNILSSHKYKSLKAHKPCKKKGVSMQYRQITTSFGLIYMLPFKYKRFWSLLENSIGNDLMLFLRSAMREGKRGKGQKCKKLSSNIKPLIVTYNQSLIDILSDKRDSELQKTQTTCGENVICPKGKAMKHRPLTDLSSLTGSSSSESSESKEQDPPCCISPLPTSTHKESSRCLRKTKSTVTFGTQPKKLYSSKAEGKACISYLGYEKKRKHEEMADNKSEEENNLHIYQEGLEWGMYKNFLVKINKPYIFSSVKRLDKALFSWMKSHLERENLGSPRRRRKSYRSSLFDISLRTKYDNQVRAALKLDWPDSLSKPLIGGDSKSITYGTDDLIRTNKRLTKWHRFRNIRKAMEMCTKLHDVIPEANRIKMSHLPNNFKLQLLDENYHSLRKIRECFISRKLRKIQNYCIYRSKNRQPFLQQNIINSIYSQRQKFYREKLRKTEQFHREYIIHKSHILLCLENVRKAECKLNSSLMAANEKWDHLQRKKDVIMNLLLMFSHERNLKKIKEATQEAIDKHGGNGEFLDSRRQMQRDYERFVLKELRSMSAEELEDGLSQPNPAAGVCEDETVYLHRETNPYLSGNAFSSSLGRQQVVKPTVPESFYCLMESMSAKIKRQEEALKSMRYITEMKDPRRYVK